LSKRNDGFDKVPKDFYPTTDVKAVEPLVPFIRGVIYAEPFYGDGDLEDLLMDVATCKWRSDIRETVLSSKVMPATDLTQYDLEGIDCIISNPPFTKGILLPCIDHLIKLKPTWLLLPADMMHNKYFGDYMGICNRVVSIGRVCWFPKDGKRVASTDNFAWYYWEDDKSCNTSFYGRNTNG